MILFIRIIKNFRILRDEDEWILRRPLELHLTTIKRDKYSPNWIIQDRLVIMFLYYAGLRLDEARNIKWPDIDFDREILLLKKQESKKM